MAQDYTLSQDCPATVIPAGDVSADMDRFRDFYADKRGVKPENKTTPRLREEDSAIA